MKNVASIQIVSVSCLLTILSVAAAAAAGDPTQPLAAQDLVFAETGGLVAVEAEHFTAQAKIDKRAWHLTTAQLHDGVQPDGDGPHVRNASGGAYLEILPDTRRNHGHKLINGENFSNQPGQLGVLSYRVHFDTPGKYHVWVRAYSSGSEDNGLHVGIDGNWPESGQRLQWCEGKNTWRWESRQRTPKNHCGEPGKIFLEVKEPGLHTIQFSMREDGFEFDKWLMTLDPAFERPAGAGPAPRAWKGHLPQAFAVPANYRDADSPAGNNAKLGRLTSVAVKQTNPLVLPRQPDGDGAVAISGELKQWHKVTLTLNGPYAHELDNDPNPFTDYRLTVEFTHESGSPHYRVPGYFAAAGNAANSSAVSGVKWRAHLSPDKTGRWHYTIHFVKGKLAALNPDAPAQPAAPYEGRAGTFTIAPSDKTGRDLRARGRLQYVGKHYLRFAGSGEYFLKAGADAPENLLAYADFDGTWSNKKGRKPRPGEASPAGLKTWQPHMRDWRPGDPTWKNGKGKGLIGALNYLSGKGGNAFSFLSYNAGGDGDDVWPFVDRNDKLHYDCSKLDQWGIVFDHATAKGLYLHFKMQEQEMDDNRGGRQRGGIVPTALDQGDLGPERKLYCRELIARFGHALALNWNLGEENTQSTEQQRAMAQYLRDTDPYNHHIVVHTFPNAQDKIYPALLGDQSALTGASLQNHWQAAHQRTLKWVKESDRAGKPWVVANDEQNPAGLGVPPDPGFEGFDGTAKDKNSTYDLHDIRKYTLWGNLMAGGAGVEYYFGYKLPQNDLVCENWRSRDQSWDYCRIALEFFPANHIPFWEMHNADALVGNPKNDNRKYCLAQPGVVYLVYLPNGGTTDLDLTGASGRYRVSWFNPRTGGALQPGAIQQVRGGARAALGQPPADTDQDWLIVVRKI